MKITSVNNDLVKATAKLLKNKYREETGLFLIEGEKCILEAINANIEIEHIFVLEGINIQENLGLEREFSCQVFETTEAVLSKISDAKSAPKMVAVARQRTFALKDLRKSKQVVLLEGIKDAGNLGTILRTACAFGIDTIVLYGDTVDLYNPKCVRSAVGNLWKIPVIKIDSFSELAEYFIDFEKVATLPKSDNSVWLNDYIPNEKVLIMFGSEANGLSEDLKKFATKNVTIEMSTEVESLNLSVSAAVFMYKLKK